MRVRPAPRLCHFFLIGAVLAFPVAAGEAAAQAEECLTDWGVAGEIVRREKLLTVQQLAQSGAVGAAGQIVKTTLCRDGDDYIYKVVAREANGSLKTIVVDARNPDDAGLGTGSLGSSGGRNPDAAGNSAPRGGGAKRIPQMRIQLFKKPN